MTRNEIKVLIVDDDPMAHELVGFYLKKAGHKVFSSYNGVDAIKTATNLIPNIILLDLMLPGMDGVEVCEELRNNASLKSTIIVILTARLEDYSQIASFNAGADAFITKPIKPKILISRINALLRRNTSANLDHVINHVENTNLLIDYERYLVILNGKEVILPKKEFELLSYLYSDPKKIFSRMEIFGKIWPGKKLQQGKRTIDVHIRKLRKSIGDNYIRTIKGIGYKYVDNLK